MDGAPAPARGPRRSRSAIALLVVAIASGAAAGAFTACFIWLYEHGLDFLWKDLPDDLGVDAFESWWLFAVPLVGGLLVGLGTRLLGAYPEPIERVMAKWRAGGSVEPRTVPSTFVNSVFVLVFGGPVGFEAALIGLIGGSAAWSGRHITAMERLVREAWGSERADDLPPAVRKLPYWLAAIAGLLTYRWMPFGGIDLGFRFTSETGKLGITDALVVFGFALVVAVPVSWAAAVVRRAEEASIFRRSPVLIAMGGAVAFSTMALVSKYVLFSGQQGFQSLPTLGNAELAYIVVAKWLALVVVLAAGWRGGPVFPLFTSAAAAAVIVAGILDAPTDLVMIAAVAAVSAVFLRGNVAAAFVLSLYVVPLTHAVVILVGALGGSVGCTLGRNLGLTPPEPADAAPAGAGGGGDAAPG